ncbi:MAG: aminotransferase class III-fold pyridoxal phosphate-dependent enzyme [Sediminibacterium sp.]|nr:aminotransferase class III-fold pyridoxal phosphate-dependent enzyme [Sediminibacterium sp.]
MKLFDVYPLQNIILETATMSNVYDKAGNKYIDFYGGHAVISIGHNHPHWVKRIHEQLGKISFYSNSVIMPIQQQLSEKLGVISKKENYQLFLCNSGAEANENALKLASFYNNRKKIIAFTKSFHGRTSLAVSATDNKSIIAPVNETDNIVFLPFNEIEPLEKYFGEYGETIAAVIVEGIQGVGGIRVATEIFLQKIRLLCTQYNSIFIADSVQCGYGRTGDFFSQDYAKIQADIYTTAKGMGNGFPVAGVLIAPFIKPIYGMLGTTFGGNPLACAAALAVLEIIEQENLLQEAGEKGQYILKSLQKNKAIKNLRGRGLMIGFDVEDTHKNLRNILLSTYKIFTGEAKPNTIRLLPALNIGYTEIDYLLDSIQKATK